MFLYVVQRASNGPLAVMSETSYEQLVEDPWFVLREDGTSLYEDGRCLLEGNHHGAMGRADFRRLLAQAEVETYSGEVPIDQASLEDAQTLEYLLEAVEAFEARPEAIRRLDEAKADARKLIDARRRRRVSPDLLHEAGRVYAYLVNGPACEDDPVDILRRFRRALARDLDDPELVQHATVAIPYGTPGWPGDSDTASARRPSDPLRDNDGGASIGCYYCDDLTPATHWEENDAQREPVCDAHCRAHEGEPCPTSPVDLTEQALCARCMGSVDCYGDHTGRIGCPADEEAEAEEE